MREIVCLLVALTALSGCSNKVKQKLGLDEDIGKEELMEVFKDRIQNSINASQFYNLSELVSINSIVENYLHPVVSMIKAGDLAKVKIGSLKGEKC